MAQEDPLDGLEERLQKHTQSLESLLALTPARDQFGSQIEDGLDPSEQWNRKKQTKEEKRAAKRAKLDPANQKSALDVMKERERKRKRELGEDEDGGEEEVPNSEAVSNKRQKQQPAPPTADEIEAKKKAVAEKRKEKRMQKKEKSAAARAKQEAKKAKKQQQSNTKNIGADEEVGEDGEEDEPAEAEDIDTTAMEKMDFSGLAGPDDEPQEEDGEVVEDSSVPTSPVIDSPAFDVATNHSEASSSSSIMPPSKVDQSEGSTLETAPPPTSKTQPDVKAQRPPTQISLPKFDGATNELPSGTSSPKIVLPDVDTALLQERLRKRIEELRAKRKADDPGAKSKQELLDQRRRKGEQRKAHKKELRRQAREEESRQQEERLRGSGSPAADIFERRESPRPQEKNNFSFSRLAFEDGSAADASLSTLNDPRKKKGPQDVKTALIAAQKKQSRLSGLDDAKRSDIAEKDMWLNAKRRAHGDKVRDDTSLLKKALKRQEKSKSKSEQEWKEREENVIKGREMKQKKREGNLQKRRDEKGQKGKKLKKSGGSGSKGKKKGGRPGFEGRFKA